MVINTDKKFIFIHIPKTAGTSITASLKSLKGNQKRWLANTKHETLTEFHDHLEERLSLVDKLFRKKPDQYFTFGFVRNPWDRMASLHRYLIEKRPRPEIDTISTFKQFLIEANEGCAWIRSLRTMRPQVDFFTCPDGQLKIDFLGHYEHLAEDIKALADELNIPLKLTQKNASTNGENDYRVSYDDEMAEIVAKLFEEDCRHFGYHFDSVYPSSRFSGQVNCQR